MLIFTADFGASPNFKQAKPHPALIIYVICFAATLVAASRRRTPAQEAPLPRREAKPKPALDENGLVKLWVVALAKPHSIILNLTQKDFRVFKDNHEQKIVNFSARPREPLCLGVLLDVSEDRSVEHPDALASPPVSQFLRSVIGSSDRAFVATFNDQVSLLCPWTARTDLLDEALKRAFSVEPDCPPKLYDAIYTLCEERFLSEPGRKALIVLSDSPDAGSDHTKLEALEIAHRTDTILYPVLPWEGNRSAPLFKNVALAQVFANDTGGFFYFVVKPGDLEKSLQGIRIVLSHFYEIAFRPDVGNRDGQFHKIKVKCERSGVKLLTREGYYAPKN